MRAWIAAVVLGACGTVAVPHDRPDPWVDDDRALEVDVELAPTDWAALRAQTRSWVQVYAECLAAPFPDPFTWFDGAVTIDDQRFDGARVRKKGFLGSLRVDKPSLKISLPDGSGLVLDNAAQDPAYVRQCLAYRAFAAAGVPAPRCSYAHVTVDGEDLGVYVNVEKIGKSFLDEHFSDDTGNLYEGTYSDFRDGWTATFAQKRGDGDRSDLDAVAAALRAPDASLVGALDPLVDLDEVDRFWAVETLVTDWDGYSSDANNFFAYHDPTSGRFELLPWGPDATFVAGADPFRDGIVSVQAASMLPWRLYQLPATRDRYVATLRDLLAHHWNEPALEAALDRDAALIAPIADPDSSAGLAAQLDVVRRSISERRGAIERELDAGPPAWTSPPRAPPCFDTLGAVSGSLATTWGTAGGDASTSGTGSLAGSIEGAALDVIGVGATAGADPNDPTHDQLLVAAALADGTVDVIVFELDPGKISPDTTVPIDWIAASGTVYRFTPTTGVYTMVGLVPSGTITFSDAGTTAGVAVSATFSGPVVKSPF